VGRPRLDAVEDVDGASPRGARGGVGRVPAQHLAVHGLEVDGGHGERAVHVEHDPSQRPPPLRRGGGGGGHGPAGERRGGEGAVGAEEQAREHTWRDRGRWMGRARENGGRSGGAAAVVVGVAFAVASWGSSFVGFVPHSSFVYVQYITTAMRFHSQEAFSNSFFYEGVIH
jgi:hypothetical protein